MAAFKEHITVSSLLGIGYGLAGTYLFGFTPVQATLAAWLTGVSGMLPDLDSDSGRPVRELFGVVGAMAPLLLVGRVLHWTGLRGDTETVMLLILAMYLGIRYGLAWLVGRLSVHRGMFHSIPALAIAAEIAFLGYPHDSLRVKLMIAGGVALGFLSHLVLDEMYSVQLNGIRVNLKSSYGTALKLIGPKFGPNVLTYALLATLSYAVLDDAGLIVHPEDAPPTRVAAPETGPPVVR